MGKEYQEMLEKRRHYLSEIQGNDFKYIPFTNLKLLEKCGYHIENINDWCNLCVYDNITGKKMELVSINHDRLEFRLANASITIWNYGKIELNIGNHVLAEFFEQSTDYNPFNSYYTFEVHDKIFTDEVLNFACLVNDCKNLFRIGHVALKIRGENNKCINVTQRDTYIDVLDSTKDSDPELQGEYIIPINEISFDKIKNLFLKIINEKLNEIKGKKYEVEKRFILSIIRDDLLDNFVSMFVEYYFSNIDKVIAALEESKNEIIKQTNEELQRKLAEVDKKIACITESTTKSK